MQPGLLAVAAVAVAAALAVAIAVATPSLRRRLVRSERAGLRRVPARAVDRLLATARPRRVLGRAVHRLLARIVEVHGDAVVEVPRPGDHRGLLRGRLQHLRVRVPALTVDTLPVQDVTIDLHDVRLDLLRTLRRRHVVVREGHGLLRGHVAGAEVRRRSRVPGVVRLTGGRAGLGVAGLGLARLPLGVRPVVDGDRVRLAPTPFTMTLPPLPPGVVLTAVDTDADALRITCTLDLPRLLNVTLDS